MILFSYQDLSLNNIDELKKVISEFYSFVGSFVLLNAGPTIFLYLLLNLVHPAAGSFLASLSHDLFIKLILNTSSNITNNYQREFSPVPKTCDRTVHVA